MKTEARLTPRELEVAELLAWGAAKKEVAAKLSISPRTVENTARSIYGKLGIQKATELSVWWFCTRYKISFDLSPIKRNVMACFFLFLILPYEFFGDHDIVRTFRAKPITRTVRASRGRRRNEGDLYLDEFYN